MSDRPNRKMLLEYQPIVLTNKQNNRNRTIAGIFCILALVVGLCSMVITIRIALYAKRWELGAGFAVYSAFCFFTAYRWWRKAGKAVKLE